MPDHFRNLRGRHQTQGFTLLELLAAMGIIAVLTLLAYPSYEQYRQRLLLTEARLALSEIMVLQARHFAKHQRYTVDLVSQLGVSTEMGQAVSSQGNYHITGESCGEDLRHCCQLAATPVSGKGVVLTLDTLGRKLPPEAWQ